MVILTTKIATEEVEMVVLEQEHLAEQVELVLLQMVVAVTTELQEVLEELRLFIAQAVAVVAVAEVVKKIVMVELVVLEEETLLAD